KFAAMIVDLQGKDLARAAGPRHGDGKQPDGPATDHRYCLSRDLTGQDRVHGVSKGIEHAGVVGRYLRIDLPDVRFGEFYVLGESAVGVDADDLHVLADVRFAGPALIALAAGDMHLRRHKIAFLDCGDVLAPGNDVPAEFMSGDQGRLDAVLRPLVPVINMEIGTAD